uniref:AlNc14C21G2155 protein n=1 Tax=Albugo laibachii Nc14 TaxID=890382 RepID=F0W5J0_9STRA|nr:AlNc14C21G2155 [Albugo laibachii Nc14]|eukprot:CCA16381.1 AlNc14C21G2155 [Albugo laibachii Nc14]
MPLLLRQQAPSPSIEQLVQAWKCNGNRSVMYEARPVFLDDSGDELPPERQDCTEVIGKEAGTTAKDAEIKAGTKHLKSFRRSRTFLCLSDGDSDGEENGSEDHVVSDTPDHENSADRKQDTRPTLLDRSSINKALARLKISEAHVTAVEKELQRLRMGACARFQLHVKSFSTRLFRFSNRE